MGIFDGISSAKDIAGLFKAGQQYNYGKDKGYTSYLDEQKKRKQQLIDEGLNKGLSWEQIAADTGTSTQEVQNRSQETKPGYGITNSQNPVQSAGNFIAGKATREQQQQQANASLDASTQKVIKLLQDPKIDPKRKQALYMYLAEQGIVDPQVAAQNTRNTQESAKQQLETIVTLGMNVPFRYTAEGIARALGAGDETAGQKAANASLDSAQTKVLKVLNDPKVSDSNKKALFDLLNTNNQQSVIEAAQNTKTVEDATNARRFLASAYQVGLTPFTFGNLSSVGGAGLQTAAEVAQGAQALSRGVNTAYNVVSNGAFGALGALQQEKLTPGSVVSGVLQGEAIPAAGYIFKKGGQLLSSAAGRDEQLQQLITNQKVQQLMTTGAPEPLGAKVPSSPSDVIGNPVMHLTDKGLYAKLTPEQQKFFSNEVANLKSSGKDIVHLSPEGRTGTAKEVSVAELMKASPNDRKSFENYQAVAPDSGFAPSGSSLRTEQIAIENKVASSLPKAQYEKANFAQEADNAVNLVNNDIKKAEDIAFGKVRGTSDVQEVAVRKALEQKAIQNKDVNTLGKLAESQSNVETSKAAQRLAAEGYMNQNSPVSAMQDVLRARKSSKIATIPKHLSNEEQSNIVTKFNDMQDTKALMGNTPNGSPERLAYGRAKVAYDEYIGGLKMAARAKSLSELNTIEKVVNKTVAPVAGTAKTLKAILDISRIFRQDWKLVFSHPKIWARNSAKSFKDAVQSLGGKNVMDATKAEIVSRQNADLYESIQKASGIDLFPLHEEAFPTHILEKTTKLNPFKASEVAFTAGQWRERAELVDLYKGIFEARGKDLTNKEFLAQFGEMIGDMTSRGNIKNAARADLYNKLFFAPRNLKANVKFVTSGGFAKLDPSIRAAYAGGLLKTIAGTAVIMATFNHYKPGSVEFDPRSSNFGKIKIGNTRFDVTGGMASLATLASRITPTTHNGKLGLYSKSSTTGTISDLRNPEYGGQNAWDTVVNFATGKASPVASVVIDMLRGETFTGEKPTVKSELTSLFMPLPITNYQELKNDPNSANKLVAVIADALGIGTNTYGAQKDWNQLDTKQITGFKQKVSQKQFIAANNEYNQAINEWLGRVTKDKRFTELPDNVQAQLISRKKQDLTKDILKRYGYEYKPQKNDEYNVKDMLADLQ